MIELASVKVEYRTENGQRRMAVEDVSLSVGEGQCLAIVGPSGCGKSTLLDCIAGLTSPKNGTCTINDLPPDQVRRSHRLAYVAQKPVFFDWYDTRTNIEVVSWITRLRATKAEADTILKRFGLLDFANAFPHELSGGMRARLALARAFVARPEILLLDEAFNFLDEILRDVVNKLVQEFFIESRCTAVLVTHTLSEAVYMADRVVVLSAGPAVVRHSFEVGFPRPRTKDLFASNEFVSLVTKIRRSMEHQE